VNSSHIELLYARWSELVKGDHARVPPHERSLSVRTLTSEALNADVINK
jgi:hypothetical protein